jgi:hypothetical protein
MSSLKNTVAFFISPAKDVVGFSVSSNETPEASGLHQQFSSHAPHAFARAWCQPFPFAGYPTLANR